MGILRRKAGSAAKYASRAYKCRLCGWAYSDKYKDKAKKHAEKCPAIDIYKKWKPQTLQALKFLKS